MAKKCYECGSADLYQNLDKGEVVCKNCGLVLYDNAVDFGKEWREFSDSPTKGIDRTGAPLTYTKYDKGLRTDIGTYSDLNKLPSNQRFKYLRLRKWQSIVSTAIERNLKLALCELKRVCSQMKFPKYAEEEAARVYTLAVQRGLVRGRSMESVVAGSIYCVCRRSGIPRLLEEISEIAGVSRKEVGRTYRYLTRELDIRVTPSDPVDYVSKICSELRLGTKVQTESIKIIEKVKEKGLTSGRGPCGIVAAAIYLAALKHNERRTQKEVAEASGVTEVTIRNRYQEILENIDIGINRYKRSIGKRTYEKIKSVQDERKKNI